MTSSTPSVLLLDQEPSPLDAVGTALAQGGYVVVPTRNAAEALHRLRHEEFSIVLADLDLRRDHDRLLLTELRLRWPQTVAVVLTTQASLTLAADALSDGAWDYAVKPCPPAVLRATIARAMERGALARALRQGLQDLDDANSRLQALSADLQRRVDEATATLRDKVAELDESNRKLRQAQAEREELVSMIAHDLGSPLTAVSGYLTLLRRAGLSPERQQQAYSVLTTVVERLIRLVADLSAAADLSTGHFSVEKSECDLAALVREQVELAEAQAPGRVLTLVVPDGPVLTHCDRHRIVQVVWNLITNAVRHAATGPIEVTLRAAADAVWIAVADAGPGIPPDELEAIFEPHVRLTASAEKGHGLGLHIARGIVAAHGGLIWAENRAPRGAVFTVRLPRAVAAPTGRAEVQRAEADAPLPLAEPPGPSAVDARA
jgi:signal transduction histidine kinase